MTTLQVGARLGPYEVIRPLGSGGPGAKWQVSTAGGVQPRWRRDGGEVFYLSGGMLMAAAVNGRGATFEVGVVRPLFASRPIGIGESYDVSADGQRILVNALVETAEQPVTLVVNWTAGLTKSSRPFTVTLLTRFRTDPEKQRWRG